MALKSAASSTAADQAVIVRYASEVTKERDSLLQRSAGMEAKWITAECKNVILRQRIADLLVPSPPSPPFNKRGDMTAEIRGKI